MVDGLDRARRAAATGLGSDSSGQRRRLHAAAQSAADVFSHRPRNRAAPADEPSDEGAWL